MTRIQLVTQSLSVLGDTTLATDAANWVDDVLYEMATAGFWYFLEKEATYQTENTVANVLFSAAKWPSAAITDYSKGLIVTSDEPRILKPLSKAQFEAKAASSVTGNPTHYTFWKAGLYLYPTPVTDSLPIITVRYFKNITVPTGDADGIETITGMPTKWVKLLKWGIIAIGMAYKGDPRYGAFQQQWGRKLGLMLIDNKDYFNSGAPDSDPAVASVTTIQGESA